MRLWRHLSANFGSYFDDLANDNIKSLAALSPEVFLEFAAIMLYGNDMSLLHLYTDAVLSKVFGVDASKKTRSVFETVGNSNKKVECEFKSSPVHVELNIEKLKGCDKQFISEFISGHLVKTKNISQPKHIIVIHGADTMSAQAVFALRKVLECNRNALFLLTCTRTSKISEAITSRCAMFRCNIPEENMCAALERLMDELDIDEIGMHDSRSLVATVLNEDGQEDGIAKCIREFVEELSKIPQLEKALELIRPFALKMMQMNVPTAMVFREIMAFMSSRGSISTETVALAASLEHASLSTNKTNIPLERFLWQAYKTTRHKSSRK